MEKLKKFGKSALIWVILLIVCLLVSILLHGFVMCITDDPYSIGSLTKVFEDQNESEILDTLEEGDSALSLLQKADGTVFLLEFHKNLLMPKYQLLDVVHIQEQDADVHVQTVLRSYDVAVEAQQELLPAEISRSLQGGMFFQLYGLNTLLLLAVLAMINHFSIQKRKKNKK